ncbi:hypothetical protein A3F27_00075 [Candidatus Kaiserbacteria bacterium RIFCSPHIGHO2_12_FULL_53_13]|uniref:Uncharacterized protein n=1 Tax=Candidatus Kaiserbacteria bacterium RIFCSPHIGHO2_12_FULL_53_13 TaxID=1798502 RepID=A0A1F6EC53_9BACT|nr:MAG: hypothetical protein A3F27_00075 [Candidatus Kaiserbacteria bacterium RIFCSPHIGHO2_12_FULL_53_13]OGG74290.1 MAG: hypothetical protein A3A37_03140 [Candidatus Kaiserbacteria bacterium RIFCSPLOWO2_01_FULL_52_36]
MLITITVISVLIVSGAAWLASRILPFKVCPICAGVFLTWTGLVAAHLLGYQINLVVPALLMGGSVVGIAYQLEKKFRGSAGTLLLWKTFFIPAGFAAAYSLLAQLWTALILTTFFLFLITLLFLSSGGRPGAREETVGNIEKNMEDCC